MLSTPWLLPAPGLVARVEITCVVPREPALAAAEEEPAKEPPCASDPRTERMIRSVMVVVRTAAMLVTMVLMVSRSLLGLATNQKIMLTMLTIQMAYDNRG